MSDVLVIDFIYTECAKCSECFEKQVNGALTAINADRDNVIYLLLGEHRNCLGAAKTLTNGKRRVHFLNFPTVAECLYRFKLSVDDLDLNSVKVLTSAHGRAVLQSYQSQLFTALYAFEYAVAPDDHLCARDAHAPLDSRPTASDVREEVSSFLRQLPAVKGDVTILRSTLISDYFSHGFSTRTGGISTIETLSSLNLFSSSWRRDPRGIVDENIRRLAVTAGFFPKHVHLVKVNHGADVWVMGKEEPERYDGIVTNQSGVVIAAPGADCMPILFTDPMSKVIGAAHAGWKGTLMGVAMATVNAMVREFGCRVRDISVVIGPSVGACCFTWKREQAVQFHNIHPRCVPDLDADTPHIDIRLATRILLQRGGVLPEHIHDDTVTDRPCVTPCTSCHPESFFSHVRDGLNFGTQIAFLWIRETEGEREGGGREGERD